MIDFKEISTTQYVFFLGIGSLGAIDAYLFRKMYNVNLGLYIFLVSLTFSENWNSSIFETLNQFSLSFF